MTLIVEDGSIVANANSYVSTADLTAFVAARGITLAGDEEQLLIKAMDYLETLQYQGLKLTMNQPLQWPRSYVVIDGYALNPHSIPKELKDAQMQVAIAIDEGHGPQEDIVRNVSSEKVGELEVHYAAGSVSAEVNIKIPASLYKLLAYGSGNSGNIIPVRRA